MSDPPSYDQDLLSRLNALKKSSISSLDQSRPQPSRQSPSNPESDLSARLRSLRNASSSPSPSPAQVSKAPPPATPAKELADFPLIPSTLSDDTDPLRDIDDKTLDELLADLGPDDQWTLDPDDPKDIQKLLDEARTAIPRDDDKVTRASHSKSAEREGESKELKSKWDKDYLAKDIDFSVFASDNEDEDEDSKGKEKEKAKEKESKLEEDESREADEIVRRMLDEIANEPPEESKPVEHPTPSQNTGDRGDFSLPSAPSTLPSPPPLTTKKSIDFESDISARLAALKGLSSTDALGLPSAPKFKPSDKPLKGVIKKPTYTDEDIDTWCVICQDDATVKCLGCEGDLYCANCWKEGHMGPDAGMDEKGHKWTRYRRPK